jgi:hypothetical protein
MGPRTGIDDENSKTLPIPGLKLRTSGRPALSQSLYRLCYPALHRCGVLINRELCSVQLCYVRYYFVQRCRWGDGNILQQ